MSVNNFYIKMDQQIDDALQNNEKFLNLLKGEDFNQHIRSLIESRKKAEVEMYIHKVNGRHEDAEKLKNQISATNARLKKISFELDKLLKAENEKLHVFAYTMGPPLMYEGNPLAESVKEQNAKKEYFVSMMKTLDQIDDVRNIADTPLLTKKQAKQAAKKQMEGLRSERRAEKGKPDSIGEDTGNFLKKRIKEGGSQFFSRLAKAIANKTEKKEAAPSTATVTATEILQETMAKIKEYTQLHTQRKKKKGLTPLGFLLTANTHQKYDNMVLLGEEIGKILNTANQKLDSHELTPKDAQAALTKIQSLRAMNKTEYSGTFSSKGRIEAILEKAERRLTDSLNTNKREKPGQ